MPLRDIELIGIYSLSRFFRREELPVETICSRESMVALCLAKNLSDRIAKWD